MKNLFAVDFAEKTITATKATMKKTSIPNSAEYKALMKLMKQHPTFEITEKHIQTNGNKRVYNGLTFDVMKAHLESQDNGEALLDEFKNIRAKAKEMGKSVYPVAKQWFLEKYPKFKVSEGKQTARKANLTHIKVAAKSGKVVALSPASGQ